MGLDTSRLESEYAGQRKTVIWELRKEKSITKQTKQNEERRKKILRETNTMVIDQSKERENQYRMVHEAGALAKVNACTDTHMKHTASEGKVQKGEKCCHLRDGR